MIDSDEKYFCMSGDIPVGGPSTWHVIDWDQRRVISVTMDGEQDDEDLAVEHLSRHSSELLPGIYGIYVSQTGEIISMDTDAENDYSQCVHYPFLHEIVLPDGIQTVRRDALEELDRLGPDADLVAYPACSKGSAKKVVFKYYFLWQYAPRHWKEMNLWMRLPRHPNIVPFDRVVVDELEGRVVGFTNDYVPGGTLEENGSRVFKLKWLQQLMQAVDDLNLRYGISHQDIAPRNLLVDESTDCVKLFDFNFAARIKNTFPNEGESYEEERNDVKGVIFTVYEIITRDNSLRSKPHEQQNLGELQQEWVKHPEVKLDQPVEVYRRVLQDWQQRRAVDPSGAHTGDAPEAINWPSRPSPPQESLGTDIYGQPSPILVDKWYERRWEVLARGGKILNWERPPQSRLIDGTRLLSIGEVLNC
ncbi:kinase-like domain-containing protein [Xylariaceae sp. FL0662B]|nr:kinase-like domain-containing protein [Xylariaceae sp. FL0662B]